MKTWNDTAALPDALDALKLRDPLRHIDAAYREERGKPKPTEEQEALAKLLDDIGNWPAFLTFTFRPNADEEVVWNKDEEHVRNKRVSWTEGEKIARTRPDRNGAVKTATRRVAPGWSSYAAHGKIIEFMAGSKDLRKGRWFTVVEPHKFRSAYPGHALVAGNVYAHWEAIAREWQRKYGRFSFELVRDEDGMAAYLAKKYVGKMYGSEDFRFAFSRSCRRPKQDTTHPLQWRARHLLFLDSYKENWMTKKAYKHIRASCQKQRTDSLPSRGERGRELVSN